MTQNEKDILKMSKLKWRNYMRKSYPNFKVKQWARTGYRLAHPQVISN